MAWSTKPSKNVLKNPPPPKFHYKAVQFNILWLNLNKIGEISILQSAHKQGNPSFIFMRRAQNADTHALKQPRLSKKNISPVCSSFVLVIAFDIHLQSQSKKRTKNVDLHTAKNIQIQSTLFDYFYTIFYKLTSDLFTVV